MIGWIDWWLVGLVVNWMDVRIVDCLLCINEWSIGCLIGWIDGWLVHLLVDWFVDLLISRMVSGLIGLDLGVNCTTPFV